jgi:glycerate-2-kinase
MNDLMFDQFTKIPYVDSLQRIIQAGLNAVRPEDRIRRTLSRNGNCLVVGDDVFNLEDLEHVVILGAGKASLGMAKGVAEIAAEKLGESLVIVKSNPNTSRSTMLNCCMAIIRFRGKGV